MYLLEIGLIILAALVYLLFHIQGVILAFPLLFTIWIFVTKRPSILMYFANKAYYEGKMVEALKRYRKISTLTRATPYMVLSYSYLLLKDGQIEESRKIAKLVEAKKPKKDSDRLYLHAIFALIKWKEGDLDSGISILEMAHEKGLRNTTTFGTLGNFYNQKGDLELALTKCLEAKEYNDRNSVIMDNLVECYLLRGEIDRAAEEAEILIELKPNFPEAYVHYADIQLSKGNKEKAIEALENALTKPFSSLSNVTQSQIKEMIQELKVERS